MKKIGVTIIILVCILFVQVKAKTIKKSRGGIILQQISLIPSDMMNILSYPIRNPGRTALFTGLSLGLCATDKETTSWIQDNINPAFDWKLPELNLFPPAIGAGADGYLLLGISSLYLGSLLIDDEKGQQAAILSTKALCYSFLYSHMMLKTFFARLRPDPNLSKSSINQYPYTQDTWDFGNSHPVYINSHSYGTAFPSFHFTAFFAVAKVLSDVYENSVVPYALCVLGLLPNFKGHNHWVSDMVAGALIGTMIGGEVVDTMKKDDLVKEVVSKDWQIYPTIYNGGVILTFQKNL
jgi:hypothetical protein